jgi:hypothetical protein
MNVKSAFVNLNNGKKLHHYRDGDGNRNQFCRTRKHQTIFPSIALLCVSSQSKVSHRKNKGIELNYALEIITQTLCLHKSERVNYLTFLIYILSFAVLWHL